MRPRFTTVFLLLALCPASAMTLAAQAAPRAAALRRELEERFARQVKEELQLTDEQTAKVRTIMSGYADRRRQMENDERDLRQALNGQLRPGIAANADSVGKLVDGIAATRVNYAKLIQDEMRELGTVLNPIQRGQLFLMRDRLLQRVQEMREQARLRDLSQPPSP